MRGVHEEKAGMAIQEDHEKRAGTVVRGDPKKI